MRHDVWRNILAEGTANFRALPFGPAVEVEGAADNEQQHRYGGIECVEQKPFITIKRPGTDEKDGDRSASQQCGSARRDSGKYEGQTQHGEQDEDDLEAARIVRP